MSIKLPKLKRADFNKVKKKKILLLSDDMRLHSGVGTMSKEVVLNTCDTYDWVQVGGAIKHPDGGKRIDISEDIGKQTGKQCSVVIYPVSGYGDPQLIRHLINSEKPDAIMHFTDPRFWGWLYQMEHEIRQHIPIMYYNIWDDLPFPHWNEPFYESCDLLAAISKQTYNINKHVSQITPRVEGKDLVYIPHGIDHNKFRPIEISDPHFTNLCNFRQNLFGVNDPDFVLFFNSRNIRRKNPSNLILAYKLLCDSLPKEDAANMCLLLHTDRVDPNGTDLPAVINAICPNYRVQFTDRKYNEQELNYLYNIADITCQPSSAEGFGLSVCESLMAGTPIMATCIGGLQDQMGFKNDNGNLLTSFSRTYLAEPEANALFVAVCNNGSILPSRAIESYRYAVDNEEQTGNRDVFIGQPLHYDRLQRCLDAQTGLGFKNAQLKFYQNTLQQPGAYAQPVSMICETLEKTEGNKKVALQIECAATLQQIILYKMMAKTITK